MVVTFLAITIIIFAIIRMAPGDPTQNQVNFSEQQQNEGGRMGALIRFKQAHNLDKPLFWNGRPYTDFEGEVDFYHNFFTWHVPGRTKFLQEAEGETRERVTQYLQNIRFPQVDRVFDGEPDDIRQAAREMVLQTIQLNLPDRQLWLVPHFIQNIREDGEDIVSRLEAARSFQERMSDLQSRFEEGELENADLRQEVGEAMDLFTGDHGNVTVPEEVTYLDPNVPVHANIDILEAHLMVGSERERAPPREAVETLLDNLRSFQQDLQQEDLTTPERNSIRRDISESIEEFLEEHNRLQVREGDLTWDRERSPAYNRIVSRLHEYYVRRRLKWGFDLLNIISGDTFGATFQVPDGQLTPTVRENLDQEVKNVSFLWVQGWWNDHQDEFDDITEDRRTELDQLLTDLLEEDDDFSRKRTIQNRVRRQDLPFFIEVLDDEEASFARRAIASQVLITHLPPPDYHRIDITSPRDRIQEAINLWTDWWEQERYRFEFSGLGKAWHSISQTQYSLYMWDIVQLEFGDTMSDPREPVDDRLFRAMSRTVPLMILVTIFTYFLAIPLGIICAVTQRSLIDRGISISLLTLWAIPGYAAALILIYLVANPADAGWHLFPTYGLERYDEILWHFFYAFTGGAEEPLGTWGHLETFFNGSLRYLYHSILPVFSLSVFGMASLALYSRVSMLEVIRKDYIRAARAKGLSEFVVIGKHVVRNGLNPLITLFANMLPRIVGGSVIIEVIFEIEGVGKMFYDAALARDYNVLMAFLLISAIMVMVGILISDLLYVVANPRIDFEEVEQ